MALKDINFIKVGNEGYHYTVDITKEYMYFIQFDNRNADLKIYYTINNEKYFFKQLLSNNDENTIIITFLDLLPNDNNNDLLPTIAQAVYQDNLISIDITTSHKIIKASVLYNNEIPQ